MNETLIYGKKVAIAAIFQAFSALDSQGQATSLASMNETQYHTLADKTLAAITHRLEKADADGLIELEETGGIVTIELENGKQFIISKHAPTRQLWLSSPLSGGLHFSCNESIQDWQLPDNRTLEAVLFTELKQFGVKL